MTAALDRLVEALPRRYPGPGGAIAVLRDGETLVRHAWGFANAELRIPFTPSSLVRLCSVTKQFTCGLVLDTFADPTVLDPDVRARLPLLDVAAPTALELCHNQSGLRDYWAVAMLHGAPAESAFGDAETARVIGGTRTLHFAPGTSYSYVNQNFRILSDILQDRTGRGLGELLRTRIFDPAGMRTAFVAADTRAMPDGTEGYEGSQTTGFRPAINRIVWTGDAGIGASLDDMIAWERHIDATRDDPASLHARLAAPVRFRDGTPAQYGFGLGRRRAQGRPVFGHGGALRGWRTTRFYLPTERVSVVVLFNHSADAGAAASDALGALLGDEPPAPTSALPTPPWLGAYLERETGLVARIEVTAGKARLRYGQSPELLDLNVDGSAGTTGTRLVPDGSALWMDRPAENRRSRLELVADVQALPVAGRYRCEELDAVLTIEDTGGTLYGGFSGFLGQGRMELLGAVGPNLWMLPCPRALDHAPPGDWTLRVHRDGIQVGCWLARGLDYKRVG